MGVTRNRFRIFRSLYPATTRAGFPDPGVEQPQGGIHVADGPYRRPGIASKGGLVDDDRGGEVLDFFRLWLLILREPAPDISAVGLVHLALALRRNGVKHDAGFPGAGDPGEYNELLFWYL